MAFYFVVRTDVTAEEGRQRVFGTYDTEDNAAAFAVQIAATMYGDFAVVGPAPVSINIVREGGIQAVRAEPVTPTE
jgi:hypothetical protein